MIDHDKFANELANIISTEITLRARKRVMEILDQSNNDFKKDSGINILTFWLAEAIAMRIVSAHMVDDFLLTIQPAIEDGGGTIDTYAKDLENILTDAAKIVMKDWVESPERNDSLKGSREAFLHWKKLQGA